MFHDAHGVDKILGQLGRVVDAFKMQIDHEVVLVGAYFLAVRIQSQHRLIALGFELLDDLAGAERNHLDGQRELADGVHHLGFVDDPDDLVGIGRHDLLPQQCSAAALDAIEVLVDLIGAVDGHIDVIDVIDVHDLDAEAFGLFLRAAGGGDAGELQSFLLHAAAEFIHQEPYGGTGAESGDHAVVNKLGGFDAGRLLHCVLLCFIHAFSLLYGRCAASLPIVDFILPCHDGDGMLCLL